MFDEYPDRLMLEHVSERIYRNVAGEEKNVEAEQYWGGMNPPPGPGMPPPPPPGPGMPPPPPPGGRDDMRSLIGVLLNNEMYRRRCRHRSRRRWWFTKRCRTWAGHSYTARFIILLLKISKRISDRHCGFEKKCIQYICRFFSGFRRNYKDGGFNRENDISFT